MTTRLQPAPGPSILSRRLSRLAPLASEELAAVHAAETSGRRLVPRTELTLEGMPVGQRLGLLSGWALKQRLMVDGQRQVLTVLVPGDLIGNCQHSSALAATTTLAVTKIVTCLAPSPKPGSGLAEAYARSAALEEHYLIAQVTRIGRLDARERIVDWLLETRERLEAVGLATSDEFSLPLTQELIADTLGLTSVHINRMLQLLRREELLTWQVGTVRLLDRHRLEHLVAYRSPQITARA